MYHCRPIWFMQLEAQEYLHIDFFIISKFGIKEYSGKISLLWLWIKYILKSNDCATCHLLENLVGNVRCYHTGTLTNTTQHWQNFSDITVGSFISCDLREKYAYEYHYCAYIVLLSSQTTQKCTFDQKVLEFLWSIFQYIPCMWNAQMTQS